jgi:hypothetical protein
LSPCHTPPRSTSFFLDLSPIGDTALLGIFQNLADMWAFLVQCIFF